MCLKYKDGERLLKSFFDAFLVGRDPKAALSYLAEELQWVHAETGTIWNYSDILWAIDQNIEIHPEPYETCYQQLCEYAISDSCHITYCELQFLGEGVKLGATVICKCLGETQKILSIQTSAPQSIALEEENSLSPSTMSVEDVEKRIQQKSSDILVRNIPGGIIGYYLEPNMPIYFTNDRILEYLGYTYEEFIAASNNQAYQLIHLVDQSRVASTVEQALAQDQEYEIQYRMRQKNGNYLWINDIGKKCVSEDGRPVCLSVLRDITSEVSAKHALIMESGENEFQARRYDQLFQSVLCGIVQYCMEDDWKIRFKNANREAIRVFGYTPEEFCQKSEWNFPELISPKDRAKILDNFGTVHQEGDKRCFEYRLLQKDGTEVWIVGNSEIIQDVDGEEIFQSVFMDIDSRKRVEKRNQLLSEQINASNELLRLALEHTSTCEFYYYPETKSCTIPEHTCTYYGFQGQYKQMSSEMASDLVISEHMWIVRKLFKRINQGERTSREEFCLKNGIWCRATLSAIGYTEDGIPSCVVGIMEDISRQKEMEAELLDAKSRDSLTKLYNKETGIRLSREYLRQKDPDEPCGLMLIDMDNFEEVNRQEGSIFADAILQEVADILRAETGAEDYQIRLGGDEFMLFVKNCDKDRATMIGPRIAELVRGLCIHPETGVKISASIGMCVSPVVEDYSALYRCAESTLKYIKAHGKGRAACYLDASNELGVFLTQLYTDEHRVNEIDHQTAGQEDDLVSFALALLGKSKNLDDAVFLLLARVGKYFNLERVSIIENSREFLSYRFSYQWAKSRTKLQLGQTFYVTEEAFAQIATMYDEDGLCNYNINDNISDIASCLHAGIWNYGEYVGSMCFEIDKENYQWTCEERKILKELIKIVPSFIMKAKADAVSQAKTDFLSRMSHEIRTPLNAISGMTTIAKRVLNDTDKTMDCLNKIESANTYLIGLINDILDMSRIESGKLEINPEQTNLSQFFGALKLLIKPQAMAKQLTFHINNGYTKERLVLVDRLRLNQVLVNILGNAVKFTPQGGRVSLSIDTIAQSKQNVTLRFSVKDTGIGISQNAIERIFNAFEQAQSDTSSQFGGTGLGLSISSRLVQMMGGVLEVISEPGKGAEFYFTVVLPYADELNVDRIEVSTTNQIDFTGKRILLAEDNTINAEIAQAILEMHGMVVECAKDGLEALRCFTAAPAGYFDAILMDIRMPVMDGLEATRRIRTLGRTDSRKIPILALTANAFDEDTKKSLECGMNGHLSKPLEVNKLLSLLAECINQYGRTEGSEKHTLDRA